MAVVCVGDTTRLSFAVALQIAALAFTLGPDAIAGGSGGGALAKKVRILVDARAQQDREPTSESDTIGPVQSIAEAVALARQRRQSAPEPLNITIEIASGTYRLQSPVMLGAQDSGTVEHPLVIRGQHDGATRIVGSAPLKRISVDPSNAFFARMNPAARSHVEVYELPNELRSSPNIDLARFHPVLASPVPFEIFDENGALWPARWPNSGWARTVTATAGEIPTFSLGTERTLQWVGEPDMWAAGYFKEEWSFETQRIGAVDSASKEVSLVKSLPYGIQAGSRVYVYHAASELDEEGEWYRDRETNSVFLWPRSPATDVVPEVSITETGFVSNGASNIRFESLTVERFRANGIRVLGGSNIVVSEARIGWTGALGASFQDSFNSGIRNSLITDTGEGGVQLFGGNRATLSPAGMFVENCQIVSFSRLGQTYRPAVELRGVGNSVTGSYLSGSPHVAVIFLGNDHRIEANEITNVVTDTSDSGAIYTGRDFSARGTVLRNNFLHDIRAARGFEIKGIYLDDFASGTRVEGNLFLRVDQPIFIGGGRDNESIGNIFLASEPALHIDGRGLTWAKESFKNPNNTLRARLAQVPFYTSSTWRTRYPKLVDLLDDDPAVPKRNVSRENLIIGGVAYQLFPEVDKAHQILGPEAAIDPTVRAGLSQLVIAGLRTAEDVFQTVGPHLPQNLNSLPWATMDRAGRLAVPNRR
jgi:hypothetical protein